MVYVRTLQSDVRTWMKSFPGLLRRAQQILRAVRRHQKCGSICLCSQPKRHRKITDGSIPRYTARAIRLSHEFRFRLGLSFTEGRHRLCSGLGVCNLADDLPHPCGYRVYEGLAFSPCGYCDCFLTCRYQWLDLRGFARTVWPLLAEIPLAWELKCILDSA